MAAEDKHINQDILIPYHLDMGALSLIHIYLQKQSHNSSIILSEAEDFSRIIISGAVLDPVTPDIRLLMRQASMQNKNVQVDLAKAEYLSPGILGLLLVLKKQLDKQGLQLKIVGLQPNMRKLLDWNGLTYLIEQRLEGL